MSTNRPAAVSCHGRRRETDEFLRLFQDARSGNSSFVQLSGRSGIGKSTLLAEVQHQLRDHGALVLEGHCRPGLPSFQPLAEVGREALAHLVQNCIQVKRISSWEQMLDVLQGRSLSAVSEDHDPGTFRIQLFDLFAELLTATSQARPVVVLLNDLEFADPGTLDLVHYLGRMLACRAELGVSAFQGLLVTSSQGRGTRRSSRPAGTQGYSYGTLTDDSLKADDINLTTINLDALDAAGVKDFLSSDEVVGRILSDIYDVFRGIVVFTRVIVVFEVGVTALVNRNVGLFD